MANDNPDGLELYLHMLHDLMQNKAEVSSVWVEEVNSMVCFGKQGKKSEEAARGVWIIG